jgi:hypothetical protein
MDRHSLLPGLLLPSRRRSAPYFWPAIQSTTKHVIVSSSILFLQRRVFTDLIVRALDVVDRDLR